MNTKSLPAVLALAAGFVTCVMSFVQQVDAVVFAKRFVIVCIIFFAIGTAVSIIIRINFPPEQPEEGTEEEPEEGIEEEGLEHTKIEEEVKE